MPWLTLIIPLLVKLVQEEAVEIRIAVLEGWDTLLSVASGNVLIQALPPAYIDRRRGVHGVRFCLALLRWWRRLTVHNSMRMSSHYSTIW